MLNEFTRLTRYHRKSAVRLLAAKPPRAALVYVDGKPVTLRPGKKRPANRKGRRAYSDEAMHCLRLVWTCFWYTCGNILAPFMRQQMPSIASWPACGITADIAEQLCRTSPAPIDRYLKKDKAALKLKSLTTPLASPKSRIPIRTFYSSEERPPTPSWFWHIDTVHQCG